MLHLSSHSGSARAKNWISSAEQIDCMQWARQRFDLFPNSSTVQRSSGLISTVYNWKRYRLNRQPIPPTPPKNKSICPSSCPSHTSSECTCRRPQPIKPDLHKTWGERRAKFGEIAECKKAIYDWKIREQWDRLLEALIYARDRETAARGGETLS